MTAWSARNDCFLPYGRSFDVSAGLECLFLGESRRSIEIKSDAVCKIGCRLSPLLWGIIYPSDEFQDSGAKSCIDILLRQSVLAIPISHQY